MSRRSVTLVLVLAVTLSLAITAPTAFAFSIDSSHTDTDVTNGIAGLPARSITDIGPGETEHMSIGFQNRLGRTAQFIIETKDISGSRTDPDEFLVLGRGAPYGASEWIDVDKTRFTLKHGEIAHVGVTAVAPADAEPGDYYAAVVAVALPRTARPSSGSVASIGASVGVQLVFRIPGVREHKGRITTTNAPRVVWRGKDSYIAVDAVYRNLGNVTDYVLARTSFEAAVFGADVNQIEAQGGEGIVLRDSVREFRFLWSDPPWIGRYTPVVSVVSEDGTVHKKKLDPIWIIPSWKYLLALLIAIAVPVMWRIRERRRFKRLEAVVAAVEAAAAQDQYADSDLDDDDDWSDEDGQYE